MARDTVIKIKHPDGVMREVVPGKSPKVMAEEQKQNKRPLLDVNRLPNPKELENRG